MSDLQNTFPILPERWWWALRTRFQQTIPNSVTSNYVSTVLDVGQSTAAKIAVPALRKVGLIDKTGKPTSLAIRWRDDSQYADVCKEMLQNLYPQELLHAIPQPGEDRSKVERWFANTTGAGRSAVVKMASFYQLLCEAELNKQKEVGKHTEPKLSKSQKPKQKRDQPSSTTPSEPTPSAVQTEVISQQSSLGRIHPAIEMLVRSLPPVGSSFSTAQREQWIKMARETFAFLYPQDQEKQLDRAQTKEEET